MSRPDQEPNFIKCGSGSEENTRIRIRRVLQLNAINTAMLIITPDSNYGEKVEREERKRERA